MTGGLARSFTHDSRGNVTGNGKDIFNYDLANQPIKTSSDTFLYDGNLKRAKKSTDSGVSYFVYTKEAGLISQYNKTNSLHTDYIRLGKQLIARVESAENPADLPSKYSTERGYYLPFGKKISNENNLDNTIGFTGHVSDKSGLSYMQARYYDPVIGRFYSNDPVGVMGHIARGNPIHGFNRYTYANNNPYKYVDPDGEFGIIGAIIGVSVEIGGQLLTNGGNFSELDVSDIAVAAAVGAVTGGIGGRMAQSAIKGLTSAKEAVSITAKSSALANGYGSVASDLLNNQEVSPTKALLSTAGGAVSGLVGGKVSNQMAGKLNSIGSNGTVASSVAGTTHSSFVGKTSAATISGITTGTDLGVNVGIKETIKPDDDFLE